MKNGAKIANVCADSPIVFSDSYYYVVIIVVISLLYPLLLCNIEYKNLSH